jgi:dTDP-4-amino-4,6-dideoxygalactose transaminase
LYYISRAIHNGHAAGDGEFTAKCQSYLEEALSVSKALLTTSCTDALEMAALLVDIAPNDEVIVPSFTFVSTANAFALRGARPVFIDVRPDTLNMNEAELERLITPRTKAIVPVHYAGVGCDMDTICEIAGRRGIPIVEDNAHGLFGKYKKRFLGTFGALATLSFHETKNFTCGEGGALIINDPAYIERAEIVRQKGTNRNQFYRGEVSKYTWVDIGSSYLPSDLLAAFLLAQLESRAHIQAMRRWVWEYYSEHLAEWAERCEVRLPRIPADCEHPHHLFYMILPTAENCQQLIAHLKTHGIMSVFHYVPLHLSPMGRRLSGRRSRCPVTESISERLVRLPLYNDLTEPDLERVVCAIKELRFGTRSFACGRRQSTSESERGAGQGSDAVAHASRLRAAGT